MGRQEGNCAGCGVPGYATVTYHRGAWELVTVAELARRAPEKEVRPTFVYVVLSVVDRYGLHPWDCSGERGVCGCNEGELVAVCGRCGAGTENPEVGEAGK